MLIYIDRSVQDKQEDFNKFVGEDKVQKIKYHV